MEQWRYYRKGTRNDTERLGKEECMEEVINKMDQEIDTAEMANNEW